MLKKMVILAVVGFVAVTAIGGTKIGSYIRSEIRAARERAEENIPHEKELARIRNEVNLLDKDIVTVVNQLAKERVAVRDLKKEVEALAATQGTEKERLATNAAAIKKAIEYVTLDNRTMSVAAATAQLEKDAERYAANQKSLASMQALLVSRTETRDALEKQLESMKNQKAELTNAVKALEARLALHKLKQTESKYQTDDSRLAKIKEDLRKLETKLDVEDEKLNLMPQAVGTPAGKAPSGKTVDQIMAPVTGEPAKPAKAADTAKPADATKTSKTD